MKIYVAGHLGLVGSALVHEIEGVPEHSWAGRTRQELDLRNSREVMETLQAERPDALVIAAAKVGGILANDTYPVEFLTENIQIQTNLLQAAHALDIKSVIFLGSSCIYPKECPQPIREEQLLTGPLEPTNEAYAIAKIAGVKLVDAYNRQYGHKWISLMPTNLYGKNDNFDPETSHVLPALVRKFSEAAAMNASEVTLWGDGSALREFLHSSDLAKAILHLVVNEKAHGLINVGTGSDISIRDLASRISGLTGYRGEVAWDNSKPNGTLKKLLDSSKILGLGWRPTVEFNQGLAGVVEEYSKVMERAS
jgi:GDP-L-fucose synthase